MKKTKILMPLVGVAALGSVAAPMVALTSCSKAQVLTYEEAKEWVKNNYGETKTATINKIESVWSFGGWVTNYGSTIIVGAQQMMVYLYNHLDNLIANLSGKPGSFVSSQTEVDRYGATGGKEGTKKGICTMGDIAFSTDLLEDKKVVVEDESSETTLSADNFDEKIGAYFEGVFKNNAEYIVQGKNLTVHGTFSYTEMDSESHTHILKMPAFYLTFDSQGRISRAKFDFEKMEVCSYHYKAVSIDGYTFNILPGSKMDFQYSYKAE